MSRLLVAQARTMEEEIHAWKTIFKRMEIVDCPIVINCAFMRVAFLCLISSLISVNVLQCCYSRKSSDKLCLHVVLIHPHRFHALLDSAHPGEVLLI